MKKTLLGALAVSGLLLGGCSSTPSGPTEADQRQAHCETFAAITPGYFETSEDISIIADTKPGSKARTDALQRQMDRQGGNVRTDPYNCDAAADQERFEQFVLRQKEKQEAEAK